MIRTEKWSNIMCNCGCNRGFFGLDEDTIILLIIVWFLATNCNFGGGRIGGGCGCGCGCDRGCGCNNDCGCGAAANDCGCGCGC